MWAAVLKCDQPAHALITARLSASFGDASSWPFLPLRLLLHGFGPELDYDLRVLQRPTPPLDAQGLPLTLGAMLQATLPGLVFETGGTNEKETRPDVLVLVQGAALPWYTPLLWLCTHFHHPDLWTYISIVKL